MIIKFNPSGTQVHKGLLQVRLDIYPDLTSKTYPLHRVLKPDSAPPLSLFNPDGTAKEPDYLNWLASVSKHWEVNPMLCHFITVPETITLEDAKLYIANLFTKDRLATLDSVLVLPNAADYVSPYMRNRGRFGTLVQTKDYADLIATINLKLSELPALDLSGGAAEPIEPQTIDVGEAATDRASFVWLHVVTYVTKGNPANANGSLDTVEIWLNANPGREIRAGTFYLDSGTTYICRDGESLGIVAAGSAQTITGLAISVQTDDFIGADVGPGGSGSPNIDADTSGGSGIMYSEGQFCDANDSAAYSTYANWSMSLYGTGVEVSAFVPKIIFM